MFGEMKMSSFRYTELLVPEYFDLELKSQAQKCRSGFQHQTSNHQTSYQLSVRADIQEQKVHLSLTLSQKFTGRQSLAKESQTYREKNISSKKRTNHRRGEKRSRRIQSDKRLRSQPNCCRRTKDFRKYISKIRK